jgi:hypothetical protein
VGNRNRREARRRSFHRTGPLLLRDFEVDVIRDPKSLQALTEVGIPVGFSTLTLLSATPESRGANSHLR